MARLRFNNITSSTSSNITFSSSSTTTGTWTIAPGFPTISSPDYAVIEVAGGTSNYEIVYLTAYTAGATTGTFTRAQEGTTGFTQTSQPWVHGAGANDFTSVYTVSSTGSVAVTDSASVYDLPGLSISNVLAGTYVMVGYLQTTTGKSGSFRTSITDGSNNDLWNPAGVAFSNTDGTLQLTTSGIIILSSTSTVKWRAAASANVGNYTIGNRSLSLIKVV